MEGGRVKAVNTHGTLMVLCFHKPHCKIFLSIVMPCVREHGFHVDTDTAFLLMGLPLAHIELQLVRWWC
jgi:hypothetical protein